MDLVQIQIKRAVLQQTLRAMTSHVMSPYKLLIAGNIDANFFKQLCFVYCFYIYLQCMYRAGNNKLKWLRGLERVVRLAVTNVLLCCSIGTDLHTYFKIRCLNQCQFLRFRHPQVCSRMDLSEEGYG